MIVDRRTFVAKRGHFAEAVALMVAEMERSNITGRIYVPETGLFDTIAVELEFEGLQEYERIWAEYFTSPEAAPFLEKLSEITETGGTSQIWRLAE